MAAVIEKLKEDGQLYAAVDITAGEVTPNQMRARAEAQLKAFAEQYQTTSMGPNDKPTGKYPDAVYPVVKQNN